MTDCANSPTVTTKRWTASDCNAWRGQTLGHFATAEAVLYDYLQAAGEKVPPVFCQRLDQAARLLRQSATEAAVHAVTMLRADFPMRRFLTHATITSFKDSARRAGILLRMPGACHSDQRTTCVLTQSEAEELEARLGQTVQSLVAHLQALDRSLTPA